MNVAIESARWDLTPFFPSFRGPEYLEFLQSLRTDVETLLATASQLGAATPANLEMWAQCFEKTEQVGARFAHVQAYLECLLAEDTTVEAVRQEVGALSALEAELEKLGVQLEDCLKHISDPLFESLVERIRSARFYLEQRRRRARHSMDKELETLAAELGVDGLHAWGRLYTTIAGGLEFDLPQPDGSVKKVPMSLKNSLLEDPDPKVRRHALEGSNQAWERMEAVATACLNSIAGTRLTLYRRRGIRHFLDAALEDAALSRESLEAMLDVLTSRREVMRGYLRDKARLIGRERLGFQDLYCPMPVEEDRKIPWGEARERVLESFSAFYPALADYARHAFQSNWIDTEPRPGRSPGGFCTGSPVINQTRIFMTYNETMGDVMTLAHELGHGFHEWVVRDLRPWQRAYPMTLAETASTFAETVYTESLLNESGLSPVGRAVILDRRLHEASAYLLNIPVRYFFEKRLYEERAEGELSPGRLKELTLEAEREWYGDALDPDQLDPLFWASKLHFYITGLSFYNFPYSFGYLFSSSVFERARLEGASFLTRYEELLRLTGSDTCEGVAKQALGVDLRQPTFWEAAVAGAERDAERFHLLLQEEPFRSRI
ncbi:MAG: M3 family oligoendopeptidase [Candidatus Eremiobacterota bacterium]